MTSKLTRERLEALTNAEYCKSNPGAWLLGLKEVNELARMALAAMDSEPVGEFYEDGPLNWYQISDGDRVPAHRRIPLYRHAQSVMVVPDDGKLRELFDAWFASDCSFDLSPEASEADNIAWRESYWYVWKRCRAAMLQELQKSAGAEATCRSNENVQVLHTKSPAQSDCGPAQNVVAPAQSQGWIPVSERMPEDEQEVLTRNRMGHRFVSFFDKHSGLFFDRLDAPAACCMEHVLVTHWMPLPAAPQEVK
ncbi:DUF551 domain-containing protein [Klebsiella variicola]